MNSPVPDQNGINNNDTATNTSTYRILIVDDESDDTLTFKSALEEAGLFKIHVFNDPQLALSNFKSGIYDLMLVDIRMLKMNGYELYRELRNIDDKVKICFVTASEPFETFKAAFPTLNQNNYILKPIENEELIERVKRIAASQQAQSDSN